MISPWGVFKAPLCENYLESIKIEALLLSCSPRELWEVPVMQVKVAVTYSSEKIPLRWESRHSHQQRGIKRPLFISWSVSYHLSKDETWEMWFNSTLTVRWLQSWTHPFAEVVKQNAIFFLGFNSSSALLLLLCRKTCSKLALRALGTRQQALLSYWMCSLSCSLVIPWWEHLPCLAWRSDFCSTSTCSQLLKDTA